MAPGSTKLSSLSVRDNGCAMPAVRIYFIFEDFVLPNLFIQKLNRVFSFVLLTWFSTYRKHLQFQITLM